MCIDIIKKLFEKWQPPYPREEYDPTQVLNENLSYDIMALFLAERKVPEEYYEFWLDHVKVQVYNSWEDADHKIYPFKYFEYWGYDDTKPGIQWEDDGIHYCAFLIGWANVGTIAHETGHISKNYLSDIEWHNFETLYEAMKDTNELLIRLFKYNRYGLKNATEGHAEIYRYLCEAMPDVLKQFYPKLF